MQTTCRALNWPLDKATSSTKVTEYTESAMPPAKLEHGTYIKGLYLEGAGWDPSAKCLVESKPKELFVDFPAIHLEPKTDRQEPTGGVYSCPCYKTTVRAGTLSTTGHSTNFVLMVEIPSKEPCSGTFSKYVETYSAHWIKRAVALFTTLAY